MSANQSEPIGSCVLLERRASILKQIVELQSELRQIDSATGLNDTEWTDHMDGTNLEEWRCKKCGTEWACTSKQLCPKCHPQERSNSVLNGPPSDK